MRLRSLFVAVPAAFALVLLAFVVVFQTFSGHFRQFELDHARERGERMWYALDAELDALAVSNQDYAEWDDAVDYLASRDPAFTSANFSFEGLSGLHVDAVVLLDAGGQVVHAAQLDATRKLLLDQADPALLALAREVAPQVQRVVKMESIERLARMGDELMAFSAYPVMKSDRTGNTGAVLVFARYLHPAELARLRDVTQLPVVLKVEAVAAVTPVAVLHAEVAETHVTLKDWRGSPLATLNLTMPATTMQVARHTTLVMGVSVGLLTLACAVVVWVMLLQLNRALLERTRLEARQRAVLASLGECMVLADPTSGNLVEANAAVLRLLDYTPDDVAFLTLGNLFERAADVPEASAAAGVQSLRTRLKTRTGVLVEVDAQVSLLPEHDPPLVCLVARDLSLQRAAEAELQQEREQLEERELTDPVTGLPNRRFLVARLPALLAAAGEGKQALAVFDLDLDNFKAINEAIGFEAGDRLLAAVARRLRDYLPDSCALMRIGGDEFVAVMPCAPEGARVSDTAKGLLDAVMRPLAIDGREMSLSANVGVALYPEHGADAETLVRHAVIATQSARLEGQNTFCLFRLSIERRHRAQVQLEQALGRAIERDAIYMQYQPIVDLQSGEVAYMEALARWQDEELGHVPPDRFIPAAERNGLVVPLGRRVLELVVRQMVQWRDKGVRLIPITVNVSPLQLERSALAEQVRQLLQETGIPPAMVSFEITESAVMRDSGAPMEMVQQLRSAGSRVYIDDFGTGFSNLASLKNLQVDAVKLDRSFVRDVVTDQNSHAIVASVVEVTAVLGMDIVAEGVETAQQADALRQLGIRYAQGYHFHRPLGAGDCLALLQKLHPLDRLTQSLKLRALRALSH